MKKYQIIYADPPWSYSFAPTKSRAVENHYPTMSQKEITSLKIPIADNAVLYLWATAPKLLEALEVVKAWGFTYKTQAIWDKGKIGMGYWFRGQHEILLVGTKGKFSPPEPENRISSIYREQRDKHSKKPANIRRLIHQWYPDKTKIEIFARKEPGLFNSFEGWDVWGNEVASDIELGVAQ